MSSNLLSDNSLQFRKGIQLSKNYSLRASTVENQEKVIEPLHDKTRFLLYWNRRKINQNWWERKLIRNVLSSQNVPTWSGQRRQYPRQDQQIKIQSFRTPIDLGSLYKVVIEMETESELLLNVGIVRNGNYIGLYLNLTAFYFWNSTIHQNETKNYKMPNHKWVTIFTSFCDLVFLTSNFV